MLPRYDQSHVERFTPNVQVTFVDDLSPVERLALTIREMFEDDPPVQDSTTNEHKLNNEEIKSTQLNPMLGSTLVPIPSSTLGSIPRSIPDSTSCSVLDSIPVLTPVTPTQYTYAVHLDSAVIIPEQQQRQQAPVSPLPSIGLDYLINVLLSPLRWMLNGPCGPCGKGGWGDTLCP